MWAPKRNPRPTLRGLRVGRPGRGKAGPSLRSGWQFIFFCKLFFGRRLADLKFGHYTNPRAGMKPALQDPGGRKPKTQAGVPVPRGQEAVVEILGRGLLRMTAAGGQRMAFGV